MATIREAGAQHLVISYSGPSVAADCTVLQPGGSPSMTLASHSRVNQEPAIIQRACTERHSDRKSYRDREWWRQCRYKNLFNWRSQRAQIIEINLEGWGLGLGPLGFVARVRCIALIGSSAAHGTSTVHPADYNGPFHGWTKTDGGAGSAIHPRRRVMMWGEGKGILSKSADTKTSGCS